MHLGYMDQGYMTGPSQHSCGSNRTMLYWMWQSEMDLCLTEWSYYNGISSWITQSVETFSMIWLYSIVGENKGTQLLFRTTEYAKLKGWENIQPKYRGGRGKAWQEHTWNISHSEDSSSETYNVIARYPNVRHRLHLGSDVLTLIHS